MEGRFSTAILAYRRRLEGGKMRGGLLVPVWRTAILAYRRRLEFCAVSTVHRNPECASLSE